MESFKDKIFIMQSESQAQTSIVILRKNRIFIRTYNSYVSKSIYCLIEFIKLTSQKKNIFQIKAQPMYSHSLLT